MTHSRAANDPEVVADAAAAYFHAAAHLSKASVSLRMSCGLIDEAGEVSDDEEFDRLVRAAANAIEKAAAEYERAVDMVSRTAWGMRPDMAEHVDSTADLLASFGYSGRTLTADSVVVPVAYYLSPPGAGTQLR